MDFPSVNFENLFLIVMAALKLICCSIIKFANGIGSPVKVFVITPFRVPVCAKEKIETKEKISDKYNFLNIAMFDLFYFLKVCKYINYFDRLNTL